MKRVTGGGGETLQGELTCNICVELTHLYWFLSLKNAYSANKRPYNCLKAALLIPVLLISHFRYFQKVSNLPKKQKQTTTTTATKKQTKQKHKQT